MDSSMWVWIVIAVIAVIALIAVLAVFTKRKNAQKVAQDKENRLKAEALRESARSAELDAREKHAAAARIAADAEQAAVHAERMRIEAEQQHQEAATAQARSEEKLAQAKSIDPDEHHSRGAGATATAKHSGATPEDAPAHREADSLKRAGASRQETEVKKEDVRHPVQREERR